MCCTVHVLCVVLCVFCVCMVVSIWMLVSSACTYICVHSCVVGTSLLFAGGPKMSLVRMWGSAARGSDQSDDGSTVVSRQTADSWGGLAPPHRSMPYPPSETVGVN